MSRPIGIPLLSGPPPRHPGPDQKACRKCGNHFTILFNRQRKCMHCGFSYCSSCTDYQALMPRAHGYDLSHVCAFCIDMLSITTLTRAQLRSLPLAKLRRYISAYNIPVKNPIDKSDLVDAAVAARTPQGCLSPVNEDHYRKHSVPLLSTPGSSSSSSNRNPSARGSPDANPNSNSRSSQPFPRPDLDPNHRQHSQEPPYRTYTPSSAPNAQRSRTTSVPINPGTRPVDEHPNISRPTSSHGRHSAPSANNLPHTSSGSHTPSPLPPPPMSTLVTLPRPFLSALSVGTLKQILWEARVRIPPGVVEKEELVERVWTIVEEERRKDNEGIDNVSMHEDEPGREEEVVEEMVDPESEPREAAHEGNDLHHTTSDGVQETRDSETIYEHHSTPSMDSARSTTPPSSTSPPKISPPEPRPRTQPKSTSAERTGLCVICQDEEACIAVVDCGHLCMCRECSDLVLSSSRECPLCRTRIVTEARLLRIFRT